MAVSYKTGDRSPPSVGPVREPAFTKTLQIGIVVRDLDATVRKYVDDFRLGPWEFFEFNAGEAEDFHEYGQPVQRSWRLAATTSPGRTSPTSPRSCPTVGRTQCR
jgi:hypothetical protein